MKQAIFVSVLAFLLGLINLFQGISFPGWAEQPPEVNTWIRWIVLVIPVVYAAKGFHYYLKDLGLGREPLLKLVRETLFALALGIMGLGLAKLSVSQLASPTSPLILSHTYWIALYFLYCVAFEFIVRGVLLTL